MDKNEPHLIIDTHRIRKVIAAFLESRAAGSKPQTKEEFRRLVLNRLRKDFVELIKEFGAQGTNANQLWASIEKNIEIQIDKWPAYRLRDNVI